MNFNEAIDYINEKNKLGIIPGLENIRELLRRLGNPQNKCKCLHIGGTNGKGSIFSYVEEVLIKSGYKVGRYVSPTIFTYLERFQINKEEMSEDVFANLLEKVSLEVEQMVSEGFLSPTAFEIETAVAFLYYELEHVDFALVECGMGGDLDGTNVISDTLMTVFASISRDHMQFLGETLEEIATHKVGIMRDNCLCISHPQEKSVANIIEEKCKEKNASLYYVEKDNIHVIERSKYGSKFKYKDDIYEIALVGEHQLYNACTAIEAILALRDRGYNISIEDLKYGLKNAKWPGRLTRIENENGPEMFVDGAHNEDAWIMLKESLNKYFTNGKFVYIIGVLRDKEYTKMVDILKSTMKSAVVITPNNKRGLEKEILAKLLVNNGIDCYLADTPEEAKKKAIGLCNEDDTIIICGSLSFLSDYLI